MPPPVGGEGLLNNEATTEAISATRITRAYCMKATSRTSAPSDSANTTIAVAPPGEAPQIATFPGRTCQRISNQPNR